MQLLATCLVDHLYPRVGLAVADVLERAGLEVVVPEGQTCCGQPAFNAGCQDDARAMARHTVDVLTRSDAPVVVPSGSCADMLVHHAPALLAGEPDYGLARPPSPDAHTSSPSSWWTFLARSPAAPARATR